MISKHQLFLAVYYFSNSIWWIDGYVSKWFWDRILFYSYRCKHFDISIAGWLCPGHIDCPIWSGLY